MSVGGAITTVSFLHQSLTEFKKETSYAQRDLWKKEGEQDARLNTVERKHKGLEREHKALTRKHRVHHGGDETERAGCPALSAVGISEN